MFGKFLAVFLVSFLSPVLAFAELTGEPCNFVDQEARIALNLGDHAMKVERKKIPGENGAPSNSIDTCTFTPPNATLPSFTVTTIAMSGVKMLTPSCAAIPAGVLELGTCRAAVRNTVVTFSQWTKRSSDSTMKKAFPVQIQRLLKRLAEPDSQGASTR